MIIAIHPDRNWGASFSDRWAEFLSRQGVEVREVDLLRKDFLAQLTGCDGVMWRWGHNPQEKQSAKQILYAIEHRLGIPVFPASRTSWHFDEKIPQWYLLAAMGAPLPDTWIFWDFDAALSWARTAPYPLVFKLSVGAGSSNVLRVASEADAVALVERMFRGGIFPMTMNEYARRILPRSLADLKALASRLKGGTRYALLGEYPTLAPLIPWWKPELGYALFQEFLPGNDFDTRVTVIGDRAFAFRRMNRPGDFRASGSGVFDCDPAAIDMRCVEIAFSISCQGEFQSMAYDFLYRNGTPVVCEMSYTFVDSAVQACPGHWDSKLAWHQGNMWPQEAQAADFLVQVTSRSHG